MDRPRRQARGAARRRTRRARCSFPTACSSRTAAFRSWTCTQRLAETRRLERSAVPDRFRLDARASPRASKKLPNRTSRGSQFGYEDFAAFCALSATLGTAGDAHGARPRPRRGALRDLSGVCPDARCSPRWRCRGGSRARCSGRSSRVPTIARWIRGSLPQVYRLHIPEQHIRRCYPEAIDDDRPVMWPNRAQHERRRVTVCHLRNDAKPSWRVRSLLRRRGPLLLQQPQSRTVDRRTGVSQVWSEIRGRPEKRARTTIPLDARRARI